MWAPVVNHVSAQIHPEEGNNAVTSVKSTRVSIRQNRKQMVRGRTQVQSWKGSAQIRRPHAERWDARGRQSVLGSEGRATLHRTLALRDSEFTRATS